MLAKVLNCQKYESGRLYSEDAAGRNDVHGVFAVADGTGSSSYADKWASVLVNYAVEFPLRSSEPAEVCYWLNQARARFFVEVPPVDLSTLPPPIRNSVRRGAFSTFHQLRCTRDDSDGLVVHCLSLGDTCTFLIRGGSQSIEMHPVKTDADFDRAPHLFTTSAEEFNPYVRVVQGHVFRSVRPGDVFLIATDAVARWIVGHGSDAESMGELLAIPNDERWAEWVHQQRITNALGNDDSTLVMLSILEEDLSSLPLAEIAPDVARLAELQDAIDKGDSILIAEAWGDGSAFPQENRHVLEGQVVAHLEIYEAIQRMRTVLNAYHRKGASIGDVEQKWAQWGSRLNDAPAGAGIRKAVRAIGIVSAEQEPE